MRFCLFADAPRSRKVSHYIYVAVVAVIRTMKEGTLTDKVMVVENDNNPLPASILSPDDAAKESGKIVAAIRAVNSGDPSLNFQEPLAAYLAGDDWVDRIKSRLSQVYNKGIFHPVAIRCLLLDEAVVKACEQDDIGQVVVLGAGMDTRPYRLHLPNVKWFEVDVPSMSGYKKEKLESIPTEYKEHAILKTQSHNYTPINLSTSLSDLVGALEAAGLDKNSPVLYLMEGLVYYLTVEDNLKLLEALPAVAASQALVTCLSPPMLTDGSNPVVKGKIFDWKLNSEQYADLILKSQNWSLTKDIVMNEDALQNRETFGEKMKSSERLLFLRCK